MITSPLVHTRFCFWTFLKILATSICLALKARSLSYVRDILTSLADRPQRFAVIGGGFAGVAVAWNLLAMTGGSRPTTVDLYDAAGLAGGGSGAAAGLLHPYTPRGKGREALISAMKLISAAELAASVDSGAGKPFVWRQPIMRPAVTRKQARDFAEHGSSNSNRVATMMAVNSLTAEQARHLVPGLAPEALLADSPCAALLIQGGLVLDPHRYLRALWASCQQVSKDTAGAVRARIIRSRVTSLRALEAEHGPYAAVIVAAGAASGTIEEIGDRLGCELSQGYTLQLVPQTAQSEALDLECANGSENVGSQPHPSSAPASGAHAMNAAMGGGSATAGDRGELQLGGLPGGQAVTQDERFDSCLRPPASAAPESQQRDIRRALELQIEPMGHQIGRGALRERDPDELASGGCDSDDEGAEEEDEHLATYPPGAPSLLSSQYLAVQGGRRMCLGATKRYGLTPEDAFQECGRKIRDAAELQAAQEALMPSAAKLWAPAEHWRVRQIRSGVRALPPRTEQGAIPLAGRVHEGSRWWVVGGLGARGLVYHAWLGELLAQAVLNDDEGFLPEELLRWKS